MATWIQTTGKRELPPQLRRQPRKKGERRRRLKGLPQQGNRNLIKNQEPQLMR
ncbi:methionyl aminopeptidase 2 [Phyllostomus discolor]|uniref:Methionyl aminopeptidase 2 n=1 Tax=Phyllostomus discolor TaxID=89673 RepID=A0A834EKL8_9CHIR|nr:methionyl aminopeptidase 2 [Phyllostomus discolor]